MKIDTVSNYSGHYHHFFEWKFRRNSIKRIRKLFPPLVGPKRQETAHITVAFAHPSSAIRRIRLRPVSTVCIGMPFGRKVSLRLFLSEHLPAGRQGLDHQPMLESNPNSAMQFPAGSVRA